MATGTEYNFGPQVYPRGWFIVAESSQLDAGPMAVSYFGQDFALYRGNSGQPVMLDAYCAHMGTHLTASDSSVIVQSGNQIEGDSIRCPYHGWRYGPDGEVDDIPYHDGPCPKSAAIKSYLVKDIMGCVFMWFDPEGGEPNFEIPLLAEWDDPSWSRWELDHLGELDIHPAEILDNMADVQHLDPTHGAPCEYFENEWRDHQYIQRQGGYHKGYGAQLISATWYTGPGLLLSKQRFGESLIIELIANTPVSDGRSRVFHGAIHKTPNAVATAEDQAAQKEAQAGALVAFSADFDIWKNKRPATKPMQLPDDGPFSKGRTWHKQFYDSRTQANTYLDEVRGVHSNTRYRTPNEEERAFESDILALKESS